MEVGSLALEYVPFLLFVVIAFVVAFEAQVRLGRASRLRPFAALQLLAGVVMVVATVVAIIVSPDVGLFDAGDGPAVTTRSTTGIYLLGALVSFPTLLIGLVVPARPHPRRGLTCFALLLDLVAIVGCSIYLLAPASAFA